MGFLQLPTLPPKSEFSICLNRPCCFCLISSLLSFSFFFFSSHYFNRIFSCEVISQSANSSWDAIAANLQADCLVNSSGLMHALRCNHNMKYGSATSWYIRVIHENLMSNRVTNQQRVSDGKSDNIWKKKIIIKKRRVIEDRRREGKVKRWAVSYKPVLEEMDGARVGGVVLGVVCWLCMRWCSAGQMVLVGRWVNNDVSPQCGNYLLPGPRRRVHACIWKLANTRRWRMPPRRFTRIHGSSI